MPRIETIHQLNLNLFSIAARKSLINSVAIARNQKRAEMYAHTDDIAHGIIYEGSTLAAKLLVSFGLGDLQTVPLATEDLEFSRILLGNDFRSNFHRYTLDAFLIGAEIAEERNRKIIISIEDILFGMTQLEDTDFERLLIAHGKSLSELRKMIKAEMQLTT